MQHLSLFALCLISFQCFAQKDCTKVVKYTYDKYESEHRFQTSMLDEKGSDDRVYFNKSVRSGQTDYRLVIKVTWTAAYSPLSDVIISFRDGKKIIRRKNTFVISPDKNSDSYSSITVFLLTDKEIQLLSSKHIEGFRLQKDDFEVSITEAIHLRQEFDCLKEATVPK